MSTRKTILGFLVCFSIVVFVGQSLSQPPAGRPDFERMRSMSPEEKVRYFRRMAEKQRRMAEEQEAQAMKEALEADEQQWKVIEPKLRKVKACREQAFVGIGLPFQSSFTSSFTPAPGQTGGQNFGGWAGGFQYQTSSGQGAFAHSSSPWKDSGRPPTEGERICDELFDLLQDRNSQPEEIRPKMDALRQARVKAGRQLAKAQQELREVLTFRQQARLVLMGLLD